MALNVNDELGELVPADGRLYVARSSRTSVVLMSTNNY